VELKCDKLCAITKSYFLLCCSL